MEGGALRAASPERRILIRSLVSDGMQNASMSHDYRPGDVLLLECPFTETAVTGVTRYYVSVRCPWLEVDPQAENIRWNGQRALPTPAAA